MLETNQARQSGAITFLLVPHPKWKNDTPKDCALVVDMQKGFMSEHTEGLPLRIAKFLVQAKLPAVFTRFTNPGPGGLFHDLLGWDGLSEPPETDIVGQLSGLTVPDNTNLVDKTTYSCFAKPGGQLETWLWEVGPRRVFVMGVDTHVCVMSAVFDLFDRGFRPVVVSDLCASHRNTELHENALKALRHLLGDNGVVASQQALDMIQAGR